MFDEHSAQLPLWSERDASEGWNVRESARARRLTVRVFHSGRVEVVVPARTSRATVDRFLDRHRPWIEKKRAEARRNAVPEEVFPPATIDFRQPKHSGSFGFGVNGRIRPTISLLFEYTPRVGFKLGRVDPIFNSTGMVIGFEPQSEAEIGFGVQKDIGRHSFSLTFSNTQTTTTSRYNSSNLVLSPSRFTIGFNLYRRFLR